MGHEPQSAPIYRRRNVYIDKEFQTKFILKFCVLVVCGAALTIAFLYFLSSQTTTVSFIQAHVKVMTTVDYLLPLMVQTVIVVTALVGLGAIAVTLIVSHKIAGPLYRFKQTLKELTAGNFSNQVRLRKGDQLIEVGEDFNQMITSVRGHIAGAKQLGAGLRAGMESIGEFNVEEKKRKEFTELKHKLNELEKELEYFKI